MKYLIMTDLEGVAGVDSFRQTRTDDLKEKGEAMKQLAREVNACVQGIKEADAAAEADVIDGHGSGGLLPEALIDCRYIRYADFHLDSLPEYAALLFVGQHAMEGTFNAPLRHTYSSRTVQYYRLNGVNIGEFAGFSNWAGLNGVPVIFLAGDDKAALEAQMFVPQIETAVTKYGKGLESADHLSSSDACRLIREKAALAVRRLTEIPAFDAFQPPYIFEARFYEPEHLTAMQDDPSVHIVDERTYRIETDDYTALPFFPKK